MFSKWLNYCIYNYSIYSNFSLYRWLVHPNYRITRMTSPKIGSDQPNPAACSGDPDAFSEGWEVRQAHPETGTGLCSSSLVAEDEEKQQTNCLHEKLDVATRSQLCSLSVPPYIFHMIMHM